MTPSEFHDRELLMYDMASVVAHKAVTGKHPSEVWIFEEAATRLRDKIQVKLYGDPIGEGGIFAGEKLIHALRPGMAKYIEHTKFLSREGISSITLYSFQQGTWGIQGASFDVCIFLSAPNHEFYSECHRRIKPGGILMTFNP